MPEYRALVPGGYFSSTPNDKSIPVSIRDNNLGAINGAGWEKSFPGYVMEIETTPGNRTTVFEAPEYGVAAWWTLMHKYRESGAITVEDIIRKYGGGQNYSGYVASVTRRTGLSPRTVINLADDKQLLLFARKGMFREEAGKDIPHSDAQLLLGFQIARQYVATGVAPPPPRPQPLAPANKGAWQMVLEAIAAMFSSKPKGTVLTYTHVLAVPEISPEVRALQKRLTEWGFNDLVVDGEFGEVTENAVKTFQSAHRIDPNGEVDQLTIEELNKPSTAPAPKPLNPPSTLKYGAPPSWYLKAEQDIGFHEKGVNLGIEKYIDAAKSGTRSQLLGQPWCATAVNAWLELCGIMGSRSAMARSYENNPNFVKLSGPALGAITTMWRNGKNSGQGHVFLYDGENERGLRGISGNDDDQVQRSFHDASRWVGYYWPKAYPLPKIGAIIVNDAGAVSGSET